MWAPLKEASAASGDEGGSARAPAAATGADDAPSGSSGGGAAGGDGASPSGAPAVREEVAPFEDGQYVRLVNRGRGGYLFADESGREVSVDGRRGMVNTAWAVQIVRTARASHVLLRGAYGRLLAVTGNDAPSGHRGYYVAQRNFDDLEEDYVMWWTSPGKRGSVLLLHGTAGGLRALRANGRYCRWNTAVSVEAVNFSRVTSMMEWEVQVIPLMVERPPYQLRPPISPSQSHEGCGEDVEISAIRADNSGSIEGHGCYWIDTRFRGRSLTALGNALANRLGNGVEFENMTLCVQAGGLSRPTPLLTDLPFRSDPVTIVMFMVGTPGHNALRFPDLAAE
ncbi:hypothetical protein ACP4OV_026703 [Aristida adscensionis]